ncbi:MAG: RNA polymerase sporulation sigma factor SigK [Clostridia bacterium]|nr:RNA polymerase sporulation sigma factor SigK [Clostridia bacterium]
MRYLLSLLLRFHYMFLRVTQNREFPPPLSDDEEKECIKALEHNDMAARNKLIEHNLRLVAHIVKKYYAQSKNQDDLTSIGTIGLIKAVDTYKNGNGTRFATYASKCIQNEILMYFRSRKKLSAEVSLSDTIDIDKDGNPLTYMDVISAPDTIAEELDLKMMSEKAKRIIMNCLEGREKQIIVYRYGLNGDKPLTQRELADKLNISRSYVSRIEKSALEKIKVRLLR